MKILDPVLSKYLFFKSPLEKKSGIILFALILAVIFFFSFLGWQGALSNRSLISILEWLPFSIIGSLAGYFVLSFLDRERTVRFFHFFTILSVLFVTGPAAAYFNDLYPETRLYTVGFIEEGLKILPVLLFAIYVPQLIKTKKDGLVYGALAGMGFNIIEIGVYIVTAINTSGDISSALYTHSTRLGLWGFGSHIIWSAFAGFGVGLAMESSKKGWKKWKWALICYLLVAVAHSLYDLGASGIAIMAAVIVNTFLSGQSLEGFTPGSEGQPGIFNDALRSTHYFYNFVFIIILLVQIKKSFDWENKVQVKQLSDESKEIITPKELILLENEELYFRRKYRDLNKKQANKIIFYQNLLAIRKEELDRNKQSVDKDSLVKLLRSSISTLRAAK